MPGYCDVPDIDGQHLSHHVDIHARGQPGIMDLHALNVIFDRELTPAFVDLQAVRQKLEILFDHTG